jgi:hypothetical protein
MSEPPTKEEIAQWFELQAKSREFTDELRPLLARFLNDGHTAMHMVHDLMFAAYALADQHFPAHDLPGGSANRQKAEDHLRGLLNMIIDLRRDIPTPTFEATDTETTH